MTFVPPRPLWPHQTEALQRLEGQESFALLMAMRTGKSAVLLNDFGRLRAEGQVDDLLIIAPGGVYETWIGAAALDLVPKVPNLLIHKWESKSKSKTVQKERSDFMLGPPSSVTTGDPGSVPRMLIINIEALSSVKEARAMVKAFLGQRRAMVAIDESTTIRNPSSIRTKFIVRELAPLARYRRILSGLPTPKDPIDIYCQFEFLDWRFLGFRSYWAFRARFAYFKQMNFGGRRVQLVAGYHDLDVLQKLIEPHSYRKRLEDCYDLPPKMYSVRHVRLTDEQARLYKEMKAFATTQLETAEHVTATVVVTQILRLHQILCGHAVDEVGRLHPIAENRTTELLELLADYDGKAIVWCSYDTDVQRITKAIAQEYGPQSVAQFWGGNKSAREEEEKRFLLLPDCRFMVATPAAGGRGRTWTVADLMVYYSNTADLEHRSQSEERSQGVGKANSTAYVDLMVPGTVDEKIVKALRNKINMAATITGDAWREWLI